MIVIPAIDIQEKKVVRLNQGKFDTTKEYADDPVAIAQQWEKLGAEIIHVVDLDGAYIGSVKNTEIIIKIAQSVNVPIQTGGGIRTIEDIATLIDNGVSRVILGTRTIGDTDFLSGVLKRWPQQIMVSLDCSNGFVAQRGWQEVSDKRGTDFARELENKGLQYLIYTDIARDGMLTGPNLDGLNEILDTVSIPVIASGGVASLDDIRSLAQLTQKGLLGAIVGKALYENKFNLDDALTAAKPC